MPLASQHLGKTYFEREYVVVSFVNSDGLIPEKGSEPLPATAQTSSTIPHRFAHRGWHDKCGYLGSAKDWR